MSEHISDGPPIPMSEFTLGARYGSEEMYRDMGIKPGSRVAWERDGVFHVDTVESVRASWGSPEIVRQLSWWQRIARRLTPKRFRKSLVIQPAKSPEWTVQVGDADNPAQRAAERIAEIQRLINELPL